MRVAGDPEAQLPGARCEILRAQVEDVALKRGVVTERAVRVGVACVFDIERIGRAVLLDECSRGQHQRRRRDVHATGVEQLQADRHDAAGLMGAALVEERLDGVLRGFEVKRIAHTSNLSGDTDPGEESVVHVTQALPLASCEMSGRILATSGVPTLYLVPVDKSSTKRSALGVSPAFCWNTTRSPEMLALLLDPALPISCGPAVEVMSM